MLTLKTKSALYIILVGCFTLNSTIAFAQATSGSVAAKIDSLFKPYDTKSGPGAVVAIVRNDSVLYQKAFGLANTEYNIPNTPETVFYICSLAKQFTAYSILLLEKANKLKGDDDIRLYLPWMADFGTKVTIDNLLHHTSGIRDDLDLLKISGLPRDGIISQETALNVIKRQCTLSFAPGEEFAYSNSNYILLAEIVKAVSKQSFRAFTDSAIFLPLHMTHSHFYDAPSEIIAGRAVSYTREEGNTVRFQNSFQNAYTVGDGGLFMPVADMERWAMNFFNNKIGTAKDIEKLNEKGKLNNGKEVSNTAMQIRGWEAFYYNGGLNGYKTFVTVFPGRKTGIIVFANNGDDNTYNLFNPLSALFIPENKTPATAPGNPIPARASANIPADSSYLKRFCGDYIASNNSSLHVYLDSGKLFIRPGQFLLRAAKDTFLFSADHFVTFAFSREKETGDTSVTIGFSGQVIPMIKFEPAKKYTDDELQVYAGSYYSRELDCRYQLLVKDHSLILSGARYPDSPVDILNSNHLVNNTIFGQFIMTRNAKKAITGFELQSPGLSHLQFVKLP
jgi:CubicO group peptidase (beta-lactamase class C family)